MVDYLRRATAHLRRAERGLAVQAKAEDLAAKVQARVVPAPAIRRPGRPPSTEGPARPLRPIDEQAKQARQGYLPPGPSFKHLINLAQPGRGVPHAVLMIERITKLIDQGGWNASERTMLWLARKKWRARAEGRDARYRVVGTRRGRLSRVEQARVDACAQPEGVEQVITDFVSELLAAPGRAVRKATDL